MWKSIALIVSVLVTGVIMRSLVVEIKTCDTEFNSDIMQNVTVSLITVGNRRVLNGSLIHKIDMRSFNITNIMTVPQGKTRNVTYLNMTLNGCDFIAQPFVNSVRFTGFILNAIRNSMKNIPERCPITKLTEVVISNLDANTELMPFPISPKRFDFTTIVSVRSTMAYRIHIEGVVGAKRKRIG